MNESIKKDIAISSREDMELMERMSRETKELPDRMNMTFERIEKSQIANLIVADKKQNIKK